VGSDGPPSAREDRRHALARKTLAPSTRERREIGGDAPQRLGDRPVAAAAGAMARRAVRLERVLSDERLGGEGDRRLRRLRVRESRVLHTTPRAVTERMCGS
jgi:hypothetical protein